jgi:hypothetical protein
MLLVVRCCGLVQNETANGSLELRKRICEEEQILLVLMDRRRRLIEETEELKARRSTVAGSPPPAPAEDQHSEEVVVLDEEDLIDVSAVESRGTVREPGYSPLVLATGGEDVTHIEAGTTEE